MSTQSPNYLTLQSGKNDPHLFGLDNEGNVWAIGLPSGGWVENWPSSPGVPLTQITCQSGDDPHLFGLDNEGNVWAIGLPSGGWGENWPSSPGVPLTKITCHIKCDR